jgi:hypothetical protein
MEIVIQIFFVKGKDKNVLEEVSCLILLSFSFLLEGKRYVVLIVK